MPKKRKTTKKKQRINRPKTPPSESQKSNVFSTPEGEASFAGYKEKKPHSLEQNIFILKKTSPKNLTFGLSHREFRCRCNYDHCVATLIDEKLLDAYRNLRETLNVPIRILSGYRCPRHNYNVGGVALSQHTLGRALDISWKSVIDQTGLHPQEFQKIALNCGFTYFIKYNLNFWHLDVREEP
jgi:uncharacterized protein YcbK (DUF882 family)